MKQLLIKNLSGKHRSWDQSSAVPQKGLHTEHEPESTPDDPNSPSPAHLRSPKHTNLSDSSRLHRREIHSLIAHKKGECHINLGCFNSINIIVEIRTCEHSSSAFSSAAFRWLWSGCDSGVFSKIWNRQTAEWETFEFTESRVLPEHQAWCVFVPSVRSWWWAGIGWLAAWVWAGSWTEAFPYTWDPWLTSDWDR